MKTVSLKHFRDHLGEIVAKVKVSGEPIELTAHGKAQVILYPHLSEEEEDHALGLMAQEAKREGGWVSHEEVGRRIRGKRK